MKVLRRLRPTKKLPAWKRKKLEQQTSNRDAAKSKWLHHSVKSIHKALKLAKQFEIKKISRRVVQAKHPAENGNAAKDAGAAVAKLEQQLQTLKTMDLDKLAQQAAAQAGFAEPPAEATGGPGGMDVVLGQRLLGASCVVKQLDASAKDFRRKFGSADDAEKEEPATGDLDDDGDDVASTSEASGGSASLGSDPSDEGDAAAAPVELDEVAAAALEKLRTGRSALAAAASASDDSSGAITLPSVSTSGDDDEADGGTTSKAAASSKRKREGTAKGAANGPPAKRMGQRARRALYEQKYGLKANHLAKQMQLQQAPPGPMQKVQYPGPPTAQQPDAAGASLHPSWEAKRQQKAALAAAGHATKVVFGEDGSEQPVVLSPPAARPPTTKPETTGAHAARENVGTSRGAGRGSNMHGMAGHGGRGAQPRGRGGRASHFSGRGAAEIGGRGGDFAAGRGRRAAGNSSSAAQQAGRGAGSAFAGGRGGVRAQGPGRSSSGRGDPGFIPVSEMHPSWQAKKMQAAAQPAGKKVVFADD